MDGCNMLIALNYVTLLPNKQSIHFGACILVGQWCRHLQKIKENSDLDKSGESMGDPTLTSKYVQKQGNNYVLQMFLPSTFNSFFPNKKNAKGETIRDLFFSIRETIKEILVDQRRLYNNHWPSRKRNLLLVRPSLKSSKLILTILKKSKHFAKETYLSHFLTYLSVHF